MQQLLLRIKRGNAWPYRILRSAAEYFLLRARAPAPRFLLPVLRVGYAVHFGLIRTLRRVGIFCYGEPLFRGRCEVVGDGLRLAGMPYVSGHSAIVLGKDVQIGRKLMIFSGRFLEHPRLAIGDGACIGDRCRISVNQEVVVGERVTIGNDCRISDNDGHPRDTDSRSAKRAGPELRDVRPVWIGGGVQIGSSCRIMKGVQIGEGAIVGPNSVVMHKLPPYCFAAGNPAEVRIRDMRLHDTSADGASV